MNVRVPDCGDMGWNEIRSRGRKIGREVGHARPLASVALRRTRLSRACLAFLGGLLLWPTLAGAASLPEGHRVVAGDVAVVAEGDLGLQLRQTSDSALINWLNFDIAKDARVDVNQPSAHALLVNRVTGDVASTLDGILHANGVVWLINPNGITIGPTGTVDAGGFLASTLDIADDAPQTLQSLRHSLMARGERARADAPHAAVDNHGVIRIRDGGKAALVGAAVTNGGRIVADGGEVGILGYRSGGASDAVNLSGLIRARSTPTAPGAVVVDGFNGDVRLVGLIDASGSAAKGGSVYIKGRRIHADALRVDASGAHGGGDLTLVANGIPGAASLTLLPHVQLMAQASCAGPGGVIGLTSSGTVDFDGRIDASGKSDAPALEAMPATVRHAQRDGRGGHVGIMALERLTVGGEIGVHGAPGALVGTVVFDGPHTHIGAASIGQNGVAASRAPTATVCEAALHSAGLAADRRATVDQATQAPAPLGVMVDLPARSASGARTRNQGNQGDQGDQGQQAADAAREQRACTPEDSPPSFLDAYEARMQAIETVQAKQSSTPATPQWPALASTSPSPSLLPLPRPLTSASSSASVSPSATPQAQVSMPGTATEAGLVVGPPADFSDSLLGMSPCIGLPSAVATGSKANVAASSATPVIALSEPPASVEIDVSPELLAALTK